MAEPRTPRIAQTRDQDTRDQDTRNVWRKPDLLPAPDPQDGYVFRWVRMSSGGKDDPMNLSAKRREGYTPVMAANHPEIQLTPASNGQLHFGGLVLCKIPVEIVEQRNAYYSGQAQAAMQAVDNNFMRENDPRMPLFAERKTQVSFGSGNS